MSALLPGRSRLGPILPARGGARARPQPFTCSAAAYAPPSSVPVGAPAPPKELHTARYESPGLSVRAERTGKHFLVHLHLDAARATWLHWAISDWQLPPKGLWPAGTHQAGEKACESPFGGDGHLTLSFSEDVCPERLVFVLKQTEGGEVWHNNGGSDYMVPLKPPGLGTVVTKVLEAEGTATSWSLMQRLRLAAELLDGADAAGPPGMAFIYTWLRLSSTRVLDWYRNSNAQSKDIAHCQEYVAQKIADKARTADHPLSRFLARQTLAGLPRGGGNGDEIRMGILHIMRGHGIKEGHRPGHHEPFLEEWHQKLHTNTTPDDVVICEAYLAYLASGNHDDYWRVLWDSGRLTKDMMENWSTPIKSWPHHLPHLINPFKHFLWILKITHGGADLDLTMEMAKGCIDEDLKGVLYNILAHRDEEWVPGHIVEARRRLQQYCQAPGASRDLMLLDCALESWVRTLLERVDQTTLTPDDLIVTAGLLLDNARITYDDPDLTQCSAMWERVASREVVGRWGDKPWAQGALAAIERLQLSLTAHTDLIYRMVQPNADAFGVACKLDAQHTTNFGEEVVRGLPLALISGVLQRLEPAVRKAAGGGPWQIVSAATAPSGEVVAINALAEVQGKNYDRPTILLVNALTGIEDIPSGVIAVLTRSSTDVLSHLAIRARTQKVLLATCYGDLEWKAWAAVAGGPATAIVDSTAGVIVPKLATAAPTPTSQVPPPVVLSASNGVAPASNGVAPAAPVVAAAGAAHAASANGHVAAAAPAAPVAQPTVAAAPAAPAAPPAPKPAATAAPAAPTAHSAPAAAPSAPAAAEPAKPPAPAAAAAPPAQPAAPKQAAAVSQPAAAAASNAAAAQTFASYISSSAAAATAAPSAATPTATPAAAPAAKALPTSPAAAAPAPVSTPPATASAVPAAAAAASSPPAVPAPKPATAGAAGTFSAATAPVFVVPPLPPLTGTQAPAPPAAAAPATKAAAVAPAPTAAAPAPTAAAPAPTAAAPTPAVALAPTAAAPTAAAPVPTAAASAPTAAAPPPAAVASAPTAAAPAPTAPALAAKAAAPAPAAAAPAAKATAPVPPAAAPAPAAVAPAPPAAAPAPAAAVPAPLAAAPAPAAAAPAPAAAAPAPPAAAPAPPAAASAPTAAATAAAPAPTAAAPVAKAAPPAPTAAAPAPIAAAPPTKAVAPAPTTAAPSSSVAAPAPTGAAPAAKAASPTAAAAQVKPPTVSAAAAAAAAPPVPAQSSSSAGASASAAVAAPQAQAAAAPAAASAPKPAPAVPAAASGTGAAPPPPPAAQPSASPRPAPAATPAPLAATAAAKPASAAVVPASPAAAPVSSALAPASEPTAKPASAVAAAASPAVVVVPSGAAAPPASPAAVPVAAPAATPAAPSVPATPVAAPAAAARTAPAPTAPAAAAAAPPPPAPAAPSAAAPAVVPAAASASPSAPSPPLAARTPEAAKPAQPTRAAVVPTPAAPPQPNVWPPPRQSNVWPPPRQAAPAPTEAPAAAAPAAAAASAPAPPPARPAPATPPAPKPAQRQGGFGYIANRVSIPVPAMTEAWAVPEKAFRKGVVGNKALNLATLRDALPISVAAVPISVSLPFRTFERVLRDVPANIDVADEIFGLTRAATEVANRGELPKEELARIREIVATGLTAPKVLVEQLGSALGQAGLIASKSQWLIDHAAGAGSPRPPGTPPPPAGSCWPAVWSAICRVWASKWTDRAWLSRRAMGIAEEDVYMSVLLQQVVPFRHAYVLHTAHPVTGNIGELFGEVVVGMGETLVGNYPGKALAFTAKKGQEPQILTLPSKREALFAPTAGSLIARSDANAEDMEGYAAAGLYDSIPVNPLEARLADYDNEPLCVDPQFQAQLLGGLVDVGRNVKELFGGLEQDIEGGWVEGRFWVVQSRPQTF